MPDPLPARPHLSLASLLLGSATLTPQELPALLDTVRARHPDRAAELQPTDALRAELSSLQAGGFLVWTATPPAGFVLTPYGERRLDHLWRAEIVDPYLATLAATEGPEVARQAAAGLGVRWHPKETP
jgi:DNA-binding transcriptional LysR family regulator